MLNNRELASLLLLGLAAILLVALPQSRRSVSAGVLGVARAFFVWRILLVFAGFIVWVVVGIWIASRTGVWSSALLKDSVIIVLTLGFPLLFQAVRARSGTDILLKIRVSSVSISAFLLFYLNIETLPLVGELLVQPLVVVVVLIEFVAGTKPELRKVEQLASGLLIVVGLSLLVWTTWQVAANFSSYDLPQLGWTLGLSIWLPLWMFPYFYLVAFYAGVESILGRIRWLGGKEQPWRVRLAVFLGLRFSVDLASSFNGRYNDVARATTYREARQHMQAFRADIRHRRDLEADRLERLDDFTDVVGADESGAQLDRREFQVTKQRLRWIATTQSGRYEGNGNRFWDDLTDMMVDTARHGLPEEHGFVVETTRNGKKWRAWRQLPSGWFLGIGGVKRGSEFFYQGDEPPRSWPPDPQVWVDSAIHEWPSDWQYSDESKL